MRPITDDERAAGPNNDDEKAVGLITDDERAVKPSLTIRERRGRH